MSDFHEGRVAATFQVGARIENAKESYEKEILGLEGMKVASMLAIKNLEEYARQVRHDQTHQRIPIKEAEVGLKYIAGCIEQMQKQFHDVEAKRNNALGALKALERIVADVKSVWDKETIKLKEVQDFESKQPQDLRERPVGYVPKDRPVEEYKKETERLEQFQGQPIVEETTSSVLVTKKPRKPKR